MSKMYELVFMETETDEEILYHTPQAGFFIGLRSENEGFFTQEFTEEQLNQYFPNHGPFMKEVEVSNEADTFDVNTQYVVDNKVKYKVYLKNITKSSFIPSETKVETLTLDPLDIKSIWRAIFEKREWVGGDNFGILKVEDIKRIVKVEENVM
ncbi:hypothetical protein P7H62_14340 [Vagococcus carniphilus]|uniref:hypothetical protein n=1 Tax=Vagococcus carniphilus TaxID=218144 RepID=UPI0028915E89|nr:hypothetical protein [Vagococcus carniphilus]MDT2830045.1 hypothetical protein [Vagococcus carniphilus]MDT2838479.1 hypothetical protein [Vagococcus carniphilus]MDT2855641.1 hypothetical protein [Vagococcus carniphilus]